MFTQTILRISGMHEDIYIYKLVDLSQTNTVFLFTMPAVTLFSRPKSVKMARLYYYYHLFGYWLS